MSLHIVNGRKVSRDVFTYTFKAILPATLDRQQQVNVNIEADSSFIWERATYSADAGALAATQTDSSRVIPAIDIQILDTGSGRNLQQSPIRINQWAGTAELPFVLSVERVFRPTSTIQMTFFQRQAVDIYEVQFVMHGYKEWDMGPVNGADQRNNMGLL